MLPKICKTCSHVLDKLYVRGSQRDGFIQIPDLYYCDKCKKAWKLRLEWDEP